MKVWVLFAVQFLALTCVARRHSLESSGYDGQNWPASMVIDTSNLPDNSAQHDMFYGGGGPSRSTPAFEHEERPETANADQKIPTTQSLFRPVTTQRPPRPEFTPTTHSTQRTPPSFGRTQSLPSSSESHNSESGRRGDTGERGQSTTASFQTQFDGYGEQRVQGRQRQGWLPTAENLDGRRGGQPGFRQDNRRPLVSNEYEGPRTQSSLDREHESHEQDEDNDRPTTVSHSRDSSPRRGNLPHVVEQQNEYESPQLSASQDKQGLLIEAVPSGYDRQVHGDFSVDNGGRRVQQNQQTTGYESQASFSSSHDTQTRKPSPIDEQQARLVAKLLNIDRMAGYTMGTEDAHSESFERTENSTSNHFPPPSPFLNNTDSNSTIGEINEILTRPLNASDQPFEDKNLQQATIEIIKLLHDEPQQQSRGQQQSKENMKVSKKVRVIRLPPMSSEDDSEEIVLVGERGNATIHRGRSSMFIQASNSQRRRH